MSSTFQKRTRTAVLWQGADEARLQELAEAIEAAERRAKMRGNTPRMNDEVDEVTAKREAYAALKAEADERAIHVTVEALGRRQWRSLVKEHEPREGNEVDAAVGVNQDTFPDALVPISIAEPKFDTPADRDDFLDSLSDSQFEQVYLEAFRANRGTFDAPFVAAPSPSSTAIDE